MKNQDKLAEKAEVIQAVKALFIPLSLFLSCIMFAAGVFLLRNNEVIGWGFIGATAIVSMWAFVALIQFQNRYRAKGIMPDKEDIMIQFDDDDAPLVESESPSSETEELEVEVPEAESTSKPDSEEAVAK